MTMTLQEISDRMEIQDLMVAYCYAVDRRNWDELDNVFLPDSIIDYREMVDFCGNLAETKAFLNEGLAPLAAYQHSISTSQIKLNGDVADGRTLCFNPMVVTLPDGKKHTFFAGLWYVDKFVRTPQGWRIQKRSEEKCFFHNVPPGIPVNQ